MIFLAAEIGWNNGEPQRIEANISWAELHAMKKPVAIALRIAPYPGPFAQDDAAAKAITDEATSLLEAARVHDVPLQEFEVDFDCAAGKLKGYELWLQALAKVVHPTRLVITTLPAWLKEPEFPTLIRKTDGYVLQVHSVPTLAESGHVSLCDPVLARKWVDQASRLGLPFSVACDALPGWSVASSEGQVVFSTTDDHLRLSPGTSTSIGWIRLGQVVPLQTELVTHEQKYPWSCASWLWDIFRRQVRGDWQLRAEGIHRRGR